MTDTAVAPSPQPNLAEAAAKPFLPALVILFVGSGCAALIYEIVWLQRLGLVIGASAISLGVLLGTFMGGMCLGSLLLPKLASRRIHPLLLYGLLELCIGLIGLLEKWLIPTMGDMYTHLAIPGASPVALRAFFAGICLLPPTMLMGATLPAIARYVETTPRGISWLGFFYGGNTLGAVVGCLLASWYLLPFHDMDYATYWAAAINGGVAVLAIVLSLVVTHKPSVESLSQKVKAAPGAWAVYVSIALSGMTGLGAEVVWTRQLSLMLGATVYTFSNILAVFLLGLGIGSSIGSFIARGAREPKAALGWCQMLLAGAIAWAAYAISYSLPFWPIEPSYATHPWFIFQANLASVFWAVLPGAFLWGASFPLALAAVARKGQDGGKVVGSVYAANTVGAIIGSLLFSMVAMQYFGSQNSQRILVALCVVSGLIAVIPVFGRLMSASVSRDPDSEPTSAGGAAGLGIGMLLAMVAACALIATIGPPNWGAVAWGRNSASQIPYLYPGVIGKRVPLTEEEQRLIDEACAGKWFKQMEIVDGHLKYELEEDAAKDKEKVASWVKVNETLVMSAMDKVDQFADSYRVLQQANSLNMRDIKLVTGELTADATNPEQKQWMDAHKPALMWALQQREDEAGTGNILPYDETRTPNRYCVYLGEGMNVSVAVTYDEQGFRYFHGAGKVQASSNPADMRLQRSLGHISALTNYAQTGKTPKDVLVVACGAGVTAGSFVPYGSNITIVDIEPMVPQFVTPQFADSNHDVIPPDWSHRPTGYKKTNIVIDDGRHFMRTAKDKFDVITSDPIDPWVKGCAALNTVEYYQMCKEHLKPGGIMALWIPFYESSQETSKSVIGTFFKVFPNGILWSNDQNGQGYDAVLFGSVDMNGQTSTLKLDIDKVQAYLDEERNAKIKQSIKDVHFGERTVAGNCEAVELFSMYAGTAPRMGGTASNSGHWLDNTDNLINYDSNLRLQYVAGMWINNTDEVKIFNSILRDYSYPKEIFYGSQEHLRALQEIMDMTGRHDANPVPQVGGN